MENLLKLLQREAEQEKKKILDEAEAYCSALLIKAKEESEGLFAATEKEIQAQARAEMEKAKSAFSLKEQAEILKEKSHWLDKVYDEAMRRLESYRKNPDYQRALRLLFQEVLKESEELTLFVNPADKGLIESWKKEAGKQCPVVADQGISAGVRAVTKDGKIEIRNTFGDRLERAWPYLIVDISRTLWEES